jgi:hypothetical protein
MKSIREWMFERGLLGEDFDKNALAKYFGSTTVKVDQNLRRELKNKIERILNMNSSVPKEEILTKLKIVISQIVSGAGGNKLTSRGLADKLSDDESVVNKSKFADMMGSETLEVDTKIRRELEPKIEYIMGLELDDSDKEKANSTEGGSERPTYGDLPKSELEERLIAVVSQLVAEMSGSSMSVSTLGDRMDSFEDDPVAVESAKLPSFLRWIENSEEQGDSVSEPQHKEGEDNMDLKAVVEKRMMQLAMELESDGKGSRQDVLAAMKAVVDSASSDSGQGGDPNAQQGGDPNAQQGMSPGDQPPPAQGMQQPQVQG